MATLTCWMVSAKPSDTIMKRNRHRTLKKMNRLKLNDNEWCQNKACHCHMVAGMIIQQRRSFLQKTILVSNSQFFLITNYIKTDLNKYIFHFNFTCRYFRMIFLEYFFSNFTLIFRVDLRMICFKIFFTVQCTVTHQINPIYFPPSALR